MFNSTNKMTIKKLAISIPKAKHNFFPKIIFLLCVSLFSSICSSADYAYSLFTLYQDSDNLSVRQGGEGGQARTFGVSFDLESTNYREWDFDLSGSISKIRYSVDSLQSETNSSVQGNVLYQPLQSNFTLFSLIDVSQAPVNRFQPQTVNNIRDQIILAVSPAYSLPLTKVDNLNVAYSYVDTDLEDLAVFQPFQTISNTTTNYLINYEKNINATNQLSVNATQGKTDFKNDSVSNGAFNTGVDYDQDDFFVRWVVSGQTNQLQMDYGISQIVDEFNQKLNLRLRRASYDRQMNTNNSMALTYSKSFGSALNANQATNTITTNQQNNLNRAQIIEDVTLSYTYNDQIINGSFAFSRTQLDQAFAQNSEKRQSIQANMTYLLSRIFNDSGQSNIQLTYFKSKSDFDTTFTNTLRNERENYAITYNYIYSSNFNASLSYSVRKTLIVTTNLASGQVGSNSVSIRFAYRNNGRF